MDDLDHILILQDGFEVSKDILFDLKHVKQVACMAVKHLQADLISQHNAC